MPPDIKRFIRLYVSSVEQIEVICLLADEIMPDKVSVVSMPTQAMKSGIGDSFSASQIPLVPLRVGVTLTARHRQ